MKEIKFYFYKLEYKLEKNLMNFSLSDYFKTPLDIKQHLFDINENKGFLKKITDTIFCFQKFRKDFNPKIKNEITGIERDIELNANESLIEETYMYLDFHNNIMILQNNRASFNAGAFARYIILLLTQKFKDDFFVCKPIISKDGIEKLIHHNVIKTLDLSIATPNIKLLKGLGFNYQQVAELDESDLDRIEIKFYSKRKRGLFNIETFKKIFDLGDKNNFNKMKVKGIGEKAYEQCVGFLRIKDGKSILDNTAIHPEDYEITAKLQKNYKVEEIKDFEKVSKEINTSLLKLKDIVTELLKPGYDVRTEFNQVKFANDILDINDLKEGYVLSGIVRNITDFGAFVDIGLKNDALLHISQISEKRISHVSDVLSINQNLENLKVISIDLEKQRVGLSLKEK